MDRGGLSQNIRLNGLLVEIIHYTEQLHRTGIQDPKGPLVPARSVALPRRAIADVAATLFVRGLCKGEVARHSRACRYRIQGHHRHADQRNSQTADYQRYVVVGWHRLARARKTGEAYQPTVANSPNKTAIAKMVAPVRMAVSIGRISGRRFVPVPRGTTLWPLDYL
jgi:hypothetical protein